MDLLQFGIDVASFSEDKKTAIKEFITLFDQLAKYDGKTWNPLSGEGLNKLNQSIEQTNTLLTSLNEKLSTLAANGAKAASSTKELSQSNTQLGNSVKEFNNEAARGILLRSKLAVAGTELAKSNAVLKVSLDETKKANIEEAKSENNSIQSRRLAVNAARELRLEKMRVVEVLRNQARLDDQEEKKQKAEKTREETRAKKDFVKAQRDSEAAAKAEATAENELNMALTKLRETQRSQAESYTLLRKTKGKDAPETKQALLDYSNTSAQLRRIEGDLGKAAGKAQLFGGALSTAFGHIRNIAYILPGIGIAGIFNLAFEAISSTVKALKLMPETIMDVTSRQMALNNHLLEQLAIYKDIYEQQEKLKNLTDPNRAAAATRAAAVESSRGFDRVKQAESAVKIANTALTEAAAKIELGGDVKIVAKEIDSLIKEQTKNANSILQIEKIMDARDERTLTEKALAVTGLIANIPGRAAEKLATGKKVGGAFILNTEAELQAIVDAAKTDVAVAKQANEQKLTHLSDFIEKSNALLKAQADQQKILSDEARKEYVETNKDLISVVVNRNDAILADDRSTRQEELNAITALTIQQKKLNELEMVNVVGTPENPNVAATPGDIRTARNKQAQADKKADEDDFNKKEKVYIEYYQRYLAATTDVQLARIEQESVANDKIADNENISFTNRLIALAKYIDLRQQMEEVGLGKDLQQGAKEPGGKTSLTEEEKEKLRVRAAEQQMNLQADVEKKAYNIVVSSIQKQMGLIKDLSAVESRFNDQEYARELNRINGEYINKEIKYKEWIKKKEELDKMYRIGALDEDISQQQQLIRGIMLLMKGVETERDANEKEITTIEDTIALGGETPQLKQQKDLAIGKRKGFDDQLAAMNEDLQKANDTLGVDEKKRAELEAKGLEDLMKKTLKNWKGYWDIIIEIEKMAYEYIKKLRDQEYQDRLKRLEEQTAAYDKAADSEISAVQRSSLSAEDKAALEIQLATEKQVRDENAAVEAKKIRHDQAVFDKNIAVAQILIETALGIAKAFGTMLYPAAVVASIHIGAIGVAKAAFVAATPIPAYGEGAGEEVGKPAHPGGQARYGEKGWEIVKKPYQSPYLVTHETVSFLPEGTSIIPVVPSPEFGGSKADESWAQTVWLARALKPKKQPAPVIHNYNRIDLGKELYKAKILGR